MIWLANIQCKKLQRKYKKCTGSEGQEYCWPLVNQFREAVATTCQHALLLPAWKCWYIIMASHWIPPFNSHETAFNWEVLSRDLYWQERENVVARSLVSTLQEVLRRANMLLTMNRFVFVYLVSEIFIHLKPNYSR